jgi:hypothetical protein
MEERKTIIDYWRHEEEVSRNSVHRRSFLLPRARSPIVIVLELVLIVGPKWRSPEGGSCVDSARRLIRTP